ncbi:hypothetical protein DSL72_004576 [Monilinia vaccinii-corymbosi]|uniref:Ubiquitin 3 binding protein But2 C-terminal domain-containing protein n=1 Tax=Monilinia vaccinii-corymbosi TaxID=61207 RepID=A0A8A3P7M4_9HELO|nr:hypothetical protein DSL72_004576 [Monilinia vaccinii-corymbosi]
MQFSSLITLFATSLTLTSAFPLAARVETTDLIFHGADSAQYPLTVPLDGSAVKTNNGLSVSYISSDGYDVQKYCTITAVDYTPALVRGEGNIWSVGPPQTITEISCARFVPRQAAPTTISMDLIGAANANYTITVPLGGGPVTTNNDLSISQVFSDWANVPSCTFDTVDYKPAFVQIAPGLWNLGPPQTVRSVTCPAA